jgi:UDP-N-acetyl-D-glucosamine dehydrogenase
MTYVVDTARSIAKTLRPGQLVVLESTTYPGTTDELVRGILEATGLQAGKDFFLAFSPEREDPNNSGNFSVRNIPKVVGGCTPACLEAAKLLYGNIVQTTVPVSSTRVAEAAKLLENIYRSVNIALVNELKMLFDRMGIDVWEVIEAAKTKPFGFQAFYPGPGLGGHCIPIDPFYLTWKAREYGISTRFIELAGQINTAMPQHVVSELARHLDARTGRGLKDAKVLVLGVAYKKNVEDIRESPALRLMELLEERGAHVDYYDPHVPVIPDTRHYRTLNGRHSQPWGDFSRYDAVLIATDHDSMDYAALAGSAKLIVDTRNACRRAGVISKNVVNA